MPIKPTLENLRVPSSEEAREMQRLSAKKRSENIKQRKIFQEAIAERMGFDDFNKMIDNLIERAKKNDKSFEVLRDTMGQKPKDNLQVEGKINNPFSGLTTEELRKMIDGRKS